MQIGEKEAIGAVAIILGWLSRGFFNGRKVGKIEAQIESRIEATEKTITKHEIDIAEIKKDQKEDMERIRSFFSTPEGGVKFLTFPVHQDICERNTKILAQEVNHLTEALKGNTAHLTEALKDNTAEIREMKGKMSEMTVAIALLEEEREK